MAEEIQNQQENQDKVAKQFEKNFSKLVALIGEKNLKKVKIPNNDVSQVVEELLKENREAVVLDFKAKAKAIIQEKIKFDQEVAKARKDYEKVVSDKMKLFNEQMTSLFNMIENVDLVAKQYYDAIKGAAEYADQKAEPVSDETTNS